MSEAMSHPKPHQNPLEVSATLQDLALLRSSDIDLASLIPKDVSKLEVNETHQQALQQSKLFVEEIRKAIRIGASGAVDRLKERIDDLNGEVERAAVNVERIQDELLESEDTNE